MKKIVLISILSLTILLSDTVNLKPGWNLIGIPSEDSASIVATNQMISKATGGGVGNTNSFVYLKELDFSRGNFILGQGYWIKVEGNQNISFDYTRASKIPSSLVLKAGWNLVYPFSTISASDLSKYPAIEKATGGGVGNTNNFVYLKEINFSRGETLENQAYWIKVDDSVSSITLDFADFIYRAWGIGGDSNSSMANIRINGVNYTALVYSKQDIEQSNASTLGDFTLFQGSINSKNLPSLQINSDYLNEDIKIKVFKGTTIFDDTTIVYESDTLTANNSVVNFGSVSFENDDDYSVPYDKSITDANLLPPKSPIF